MTTAAGHIKFIEKKPKILEAILYLINQSPGLSQYQIVKTLFIADKIHVNEVGRPVTFDNYVAMKDGPVASFAYNMLKPTFDWKKHFGFSKAPWKFEKEGRVRYYDKPNREPNLKKFSKSDIKVLDFALSVIEELTFGQVRQLTHEDPAYIEAWERRGNSNAPKMKFELLLEDWTPEEIEELEHLSHFS